MPSITQAEYDDLQAELRRLRRQERFVTYEKASARRSNVEGDLEAADDRLLDAARCFRGRKHDGEALYKAIVIYVTQALRLGKAQAAEKEAHEAYLAQD